MDTLIALKSRTSIRKYADSSIPKNILEEIVDCGRLAPTGYNDQPWIFVVVTDTNLKSSIAEKTKHGKFISEAAACIAVFCNTQARTILEDACAATENILIAAQAFNLGTCWVNSYKQKHSQAVSELLHSPDDYELMTLIAIGVPGEQKQTVKKPLADVIRWDSF